jgi:hypothetical protein
MSMGRTQTGIIFAIAVIATILTCDFLFFKHHIFERLVINIAIVVFYGTIYLTFRKRG